MWFDLNKTKKKCCSILLTVLLWYYTEFSYHSINFSRCVNMQKNTILSKISIPFKKIVLFFNMKMYTYSGLHIATKNYKKIVWIPLLCSFYFKHIFRRKKHGKRNQHKDKHILLKNFSMHKLWILEPWKRTK